ncbi:hypothetical protein KJ708_03450 [bacterium]|nr:hypothetical protein [bacterium]MBU1916482.1 hypothetical protein [bacterium]
MKRVLKITFLLLLIVTSFSTEARVTDAQVADYEQAKKAYYDNDYEKALQGFHALLEQNEDSGHILYNLGNVYFKMGKIGAAKWHYEKARLLIPRNADLKINLSLLDSKLIDKIENSFSDYLVATFYFWSSQLTMGELGWVLFIFTIFYWTWCIQKLWRKKRFWTAETFIILIIFIYLTGGYYLKDSLEAYGHYGIVVNPEVDVKASYLEKDEPLFQIHQGTKVRLIDQQDFGEGGRWLRISLPQGQKGWVLSKDIGLL